MAKIIMRVEGADGVVELLTDRVVIHRPGIWNMFKYGMNAKREIPLGAISEVGYKQAGIAFGEIEFVRSGSSSDEKKNNASAVRFNRKKNKEFEVFKEKVFELVNQFHQKKS